MKRTGFQLKPRKPLSRTSLKSSPASLKRKRLRKVGKVGAVNIEANKRLKIIFADKTRCEIGLEGCLVNWLLQFAHRHKRSWYKGDVDKLSNIMQVVVACQNCHEQIEHDAELTEVTFKTLRGNE